MLVAANTDELKHLAASILLEEIGVKVTTQMQAIFWADPETKQVEWVIGFDGFIGKTCQIHDVNLSGKAYTPRKLLKAVFEYAFKQCGLEALLGVVNSNNKRALEYNRKLGFKQLAVLPKLHDDGGDIVLMKLDKADCKWIKERKHEELLVS